MFIFGYVTGMMVLTKVKYTEIRDWERYREYNGHTPVCISGTVENCMEER